MYIFKKTVLYFLTLIACCFFTLISVGASSYDDVDAEKYYADSIEKLSTYGVISGYNGSFRPESNLTRAEFSKVISIITGLENQVNNSMSYKRFNDVDVSHWATGFINTVAESKLIIGYTDGSFQPEKNISYAEAFTVILRALNYTSADLGDNWPQAYISKATALGLTNGISFNPNDSITRGNLCYVIEKALQTEINKSEQKLITKLDITVTDELLLVATRTEDASLSVDELKTSFGVYKVADSSIEFTMLSKAKLVLNDENKVIGIEDIVIPASESTTVERIVNDEIYFSDGSNARKRGISDGTYVYYDGVISNFGIQKNLIEEGSAIAFLYDKKGNVEYMVIKDVELTDAVAIKDDIYSALNSVGVSDDEIENAKVYRDGYAVSLDKAERYDVVYYNRDAEIIYLYSDKVSGTYNEAFPNKANVLSIELSGSVIDIETQVAADKLGEKKESYKIGSKITVLLGKDGKIADIIDMNPSSGATYGILLSYTSEISDDILEKGKQYNYITVLNGEGNTMKYKTISNYEDTIGNIVKITFDENKNAVLTFLTPKDDIYGEIDKNNRKIGNFWLAKDCVIIERTYAPDTHTGVATAQVIELKDIPLTKLDKNQILYGVTDDLFGDISVLFVENVTKNHYTYGIIKSVNSTGSYEIYAKGTTQMYTANFINKIPVGSAVAFQASPLNNLLELKRLRLIQSLVKITAVDFTRIKIGDTVYQVSDDVQIIQKTSKGYENLARNEMETLVGKRVAAYADPDVSSGGLIRVILVSD